MFLPRELLIHEILPYLNPIESLELRYLCKETLQYNIQRFLKIFKELYHGKPYEKKEYWNVDCWGSVASFDVSLDTWVYLKGNWDEQISHYRATHRLMDGILSLGFLELLDELSLLPEFTDCLSRSRVGMSMRPPYSFPGRKEELLKFYRSTRYLLSIQDPVASGYLFQDPKYCDMKKGFGFGSFVIIFRDRQWYARSLWDDPILFDYCTRMSLCHLFREHCSQKSFSEQLRKIIGKKNSRGREILREVYGNVEISTKNFWDADVSREEIIKRYL